MPSYLYLKLIFETILISFIPIFKQCLQKLRLLLKLKLSKSSCVADPLIKNKPMMNSLFKSSKINVELVSKILILKNQTFLLWEILLSILFFLQHANNSRSLMTLHCLSLSQYWRVIMVQYLLMGKPEQEKLIQCKVLKVNSRV